MLSKYSEDQIKIIINQFEHADNEKPIFSHFSGIIKTPIGMSVFYSVWVPALGQSTIRIYNKEIKAYIYKKIKSGINLENIDIRIYKQNWSKDEIKEQWKLMLNQFHLPDDSVAF